MVCQRCGNEIDVRRVNPDGTLTCPYCGQMYAPMQPDAARQAPQRQVSQSTGRQGNRNQPQSYGGQPQDYGGQPQSYGGQSQGYGGQPQGYGGQSQSYGGQPHGYGGQSQGYGGQPQGYGGQSQGYGGQSQGYGGQSQGYGGQSQSYGGQSQGYGGQPRGYGQQAYGYNQPGPGTNGRGSNNSNGRKIPLWGIIAGVAVLIVLIAVLVILLGGRNSGNGNGGLASLIPSSTRYVRPKNAGDTVYFGRYEQDNNTSNGLEAIEWIVLEVDEANHRALLLSRYGLEEKAYHKQMESRAWENCTLRNWLNGEFFTTAFSEKEQSAILTTELDNSNIDQYGYDYDDNPSTLDKVFLLSKDEANRYLDVTEENVSNTKSRVYPTAYTLSKGAWTDGERSARSADESVWWWLRTRSYASAYFVDSSGSLRTRINQDPDIQVRPAIWLDLNADIF